MKVQRDNGKIERIDSKDLKNIDQHKIIIPKKDEMRNEATKSLQKIKEYNEELFDIKDKEILDNINLNNNSILVRPFKLYEKLTESGLIISIGKEKNLDRNTMKMKYEDLEFPYQTRGVVVKTPNKLPDDFSYLEEGMIVDLPSRIIANFRNHIFKVNKNNWEPIDNEKYFTIIVSLNNIEAYCDKEIMNKIN